MKNYIRILTTISAIIFCTIMTNTLAEITASGTGFIVTNKGHICTSYSLIDGQTTIAVYGINGDFKTGFKAMLVRSDKANDIAILKIEKKTPGITYRIPLPNTEITKGKITSYPSITKLKMQTESTDVTLKDNGKYKMIMDKLDESTAGAPIINEFGEIIGMVSPNGPAKTCVLIPVNKILELGSGNPMLSARTSDLEKSICMVVSYDEEIELDSKEEEETSTNPEQKQSDMDPLRSYDFGMVEVKGGRYMMGCDGAYPDCQKEEKPAHPMTVGDFKISKYEVTQELWQMVMHTNPSPQKGKKLPVYNVSYNDVLTFLDKLNKRLGTKYRLPSENEWEYAAKGGQKRLNLQYAGTANLDECAWYISNSSSVPHEVGTKKPNELGLYDMVGNVAEWCSDDYKEYASSQNTDDITNSSTKTSIIEAQNIKDKLVADRKVQRSSSYFYNKNRCNVSYRRACEPDAKNSCGFRIAE